MNLGHHLKAPEGGRAAGLASSPGSLEATHVVNGAGRERCLVALAHAAFALQPSRPAIQERLSQQTRYGVEAPWQASL